MPTFTPVDFDPFAEETASTEAIKKDGVTLEPVDFDPFEGEQTTEDQAIAAISQETPEQTEARMTEKKKDTTKEVESWIPDKIELDKVYLPNVMAANWVAEKLGYELPDIPINKQVGSALVTAGSMMTDVYRGLKQIVATPEENAVLEWEEEQLAKLYDSEKYRAASITGAVTGALAEPLGLILPAAKGKSLWAVAKTGALVGGTFGALSFSPDASEEGLLQSRAKQAVYGSVLGGVLSPALVKTGRVLTAGARKAEEKVSAAALDAVEEQIIRRVHAGDKPHIAIQKAKKMFDLTDQDFAELYLKSGRKLIKWSGKRGERRAAAKDMIDDLESRAGNNYFGRTVRWVEEKTGSRLNDYIVPISTRIKTISPTLFNKMRQLDLDTHVEVHDTFLKAKPFLTKMKKIESKMAKSDDYKKFVHALYNGDSRVVNKFLRDVGGEDLIHDYKMVRDVLDDLHGKLGKTGYDLPYIEHYFPRVVKDLKGVSGIEHAKISDAIKKAKAKKGGELSPREVARVIDNLVLGKGKTYGKTPSSVKRRSIDEIDEEMLPFYASPHESVEAYIRQAVSDVNQRKFFKTGGYRKKPAIDGSDLEDSIAAIINKERMEGRLSSKHQNELTDMLRARFGPGESAPSKVVQDFKNITYGITLGNPISAATQFGDLALAANKNGILNTVTTLFGHKMVKKEHLGLTDAIEELTSNVGTRKFTESFLKMGGFKAVDRLGKETLINSSLRKYTKMVNGKKGYEKFMKQWQPYFGKETKQLVTDLKTGNVQAENVKLLLWHELSDVQPISLTEMPRKYLEFPNGRVLYMLRTFTIKQLDIMRRHIWDEFAKGNVGRATKNAAKFASLFVLANSGVDEFKDFMQGKDVPFEDHLVDNVWSLMGVNRYTVESVTQEGVGSAVADFFAPPLNVYDPVLKAIDDPTRIAPMIPLVGRLGDAWINQGYGQDFTETYGGEGEDFSEYLP